MTLYIVIGPVTTGTHNFMRVSLSFFNYASSLYFSFQVLIWLAMEREDGEFFKPSVFDWPNGKDLKVSVKPLLQV